MLNLQFIIQRVEFMQAETESKLSLGTLFDKISINNLHLIISFLDEQTINDIISPIPYHIEIDNLFFRQLQMRHFVQNFLNKTDRTIYMPFYDEKAFLQKQRQQLSHLYNYHPSILIDLSRSFKQLFQKLAVCLNGFDGKNEVIQAITLSLTDPELPMPRMRKQNIGMHCHSAFQFFLVQKLSFSQMEFQEIHQQLHQFLNENLPVNSTDLSIQQIVKSVYTQWFKITYQNYDSYILQGHLIHNLVVVLISLLDLLLDSFKFYIQSIGDPLHTFIEFNLRYCVFRNIVLSLEQQFSFIFRKYTQVYFQMYPQFKQQGNQVREMTIWHCALSKWYLNMQAHHQKNFKTYFYLLKKVNLDIIKSKTGQKINQNTTYIQLQNRLGLGQLDLLQRQNLFQVYSQIQQFFDQNPYLYRQLTKQYTQYFMDISINQYSVHWCGHSRHILHIPYQQFQQKIINNYRQYLIKMVGLVQSLPQPNLALDMVFTSIIQDLSTDYVKPVTLCKILQDTQSQIKMMIGQDSYQQSSLSRSIKSLSQDMEADDKKLQYFNVQAKISNEISYKYSIVLQNEEFNKVLKCSASTNASRLGRSTSLRVSVFGKVSSMQEQFL